MNVDGYTYIIYDKYAGDHSFNNPATNNITLENLFKTDADTIEGESALDEYNSYATGTHKIKDNIDFSFYKLVLFKLKVDYIDIKILVLGVSHQMLKDRIKNLPNKDFLVYACSCHISYLKNNIVQNKKVDLTSRKNELVVLSNGCNTDRVDPIIENPNFTKINLFDYQRRTVKWMYDKEKEINKQVISYSFNEISSVFNVLEEIFFLLIIKLFSMASISDVSFFDILESVFGCFNSSLFFFLGISFSSFIMFIS